VIIKLTEREHRELLAILTHYSTRNDHWAVSTALKLAVAEPFDFFDRDERLLRIEKILAREAVLDGWTQAETDAYENAGGWTPGRNAVRRLRAEEILDL
jgi:hypothetical protein